MKRNLPASRLVLVLVSVGLGLAAAGSLLASAQVAAAEAPPAPAPPLGQAQMSPLKDETNPQPALVLLAAPDLARLATARAFVEARGGVVAHVFPPGAFIAELSPAAAAGVEGQAGIAALRFDAVDPALFGPWAATAIAIWNINYHQVGAQAEPSAAAPDTPFEAPPREGPPPEEPALTAADVQATNLPYGASIYDTSRYMVGSAVVALILPESNGLSQTKTYTWTTAQVATIQADVQSGLSRYPPYDPNAHVSFVYEFPSLPPPGGVSGTITCTYEAVTNTSACITQALSQLGYTSIYVYLNALRDLYHTQWAYAIIGVNGYLRGYAYLGGPYTVISLQDLRSGYVVHHETGHIFGANDEYCPDACPYPTGRAGYLNIVNANSQGPATGGPGYFAGKGEGISGIMIGSFGDVNPYARGGLGWRDRDADGLPDLLDTYPKTALLTVTGGDRIQVQGQANVTRYQPAYYSVSIDTLAAVEYRVNGGAWQPAGATDGAFDEAVEDFAIVTPRLPNGRYLLEARARTQTGNIEQRWASLPVTVTGSAVLNAAPFAALALTPASAAYTTSIGFDASAATDLEGQALSFCWDWDGNGLCDTAFAATPTATHVYTGPGALLPAVQVRDAAGLTATATAPLTLAAANTPPLAQFKADRGAVWGVVTPTFTFDASATRDGETPADQIQVRWDWDGNGTYDTGWSTSKVISHTFTLDAQGRADGLPRSQEYKVNLQARDGSGLMSVASLVVWANPYDHAPAATLQRLPSTWHTATALPLGTLATDPDFDTTWDGLLEARWDWNDDGNWDTPFSAANLTPQQGLTQTGTYTLAVEVQDRFGASSIASATVIIVPPPRLALASPVYLTITAGTTGTFPLALGNASPGMALTYTLAIVDPAHMTYTVSDSLSNPGLYAWDSPYPGPVSPGILATAPPLPAEDEGHSGPLPLNFAFPFFGQVYTEVYATTNGYLTFLPPYADLGVGTLPTASVSLLWADYTMRSSGSGGSGGQVGMAGGGGSWLYNNLPERRRFVFEYDGLVRSGYPYTDARTFQSTLYPDGALKVQYSVITTSATLPAAVRSPAGGEVISYTGPLTSQMAVLFEPSYGPVSWLTADALSGERAPGASAPVSLNVDTHGLALGGYRAWLLVWTNDPDNAYRIVPVNLQVLAAVYLPLVRK